jgi:hypothetical protein
MMPDSSLVRAGYQISYASDKDEVYFKLTLLLSEALELRWEPGCIPPPDKITND